MIKDAVHIIKIINKIEFEALDLKVMRGTFENGLGLTLINQEYKLILS